ncbi:MAG: peptidylprolyl isomerase [Nanoarchaeota archaeon]|nr:peptidylprolyl isomerase [Nanoarchaeota archaeon]
MKKIILIISLITLSILVTACFPTQCPEPKIINYETGECCEDLNYNHICDSKETEIKFPGEKIETQEKTENSSEEKNTTKINEELEEEKEKTNIDNPVATIKTNMGDMEIKLFSSKSPITVTNFINLSEQGYYDNLIFHRVIENFMIQGGDPNGDGTGGPGYAILDEFDKSLNFDKEGILAMANSGPDTGGSQFFITLNKTEWLNDKHTIFGEIIEGKDILFEIASVETAIGDKPIEDVIIETIIIKE